MPRIQRPPHTAHLRPPTDHVGVSSPAQTATLPDFLIPVTQRGCQDCCTSKNAIASRQHISLQEMLEILRFALSGIVLIVSGAMRGLSLITASIMPKVFTPTVANA